MQIFIDTKFDFIGKRFIALVASALVILGGVAFIIIHKTNTNKWLNLGIDFAGGSLIQLRFNQAPSIESLRDKINTLRLGDAMINTFGDANEFLIRIEGSEEMKQSTSASGEKKNIDEILEQMASQVANALRSPEDVKSKERGLIDLNNVGRQAIIEGLKKAVNELQHENISAAIDFQGIADNIHQVKQENRGLITNFNQLENLPKISPDIFNLLNNTFYLGSFSVKRVEMVGPKVGEDLRHKAMLAIFLALLGILAYITFRFKFLSFGVGAIVALAHDVFITTSVFAISGGEFNLPIIAALLTIVGYSLNDTIVVFDRIRDNMKLLRKKPYETIINKSINQTLGRTILTSVTTFIVVLCLFLIGSEVIKPFAFALLIGIIIGTYSSIFIASPVILFWHKIASKYGK